MTQCFVNLLILLMLIFLKARLRSCYGNHISKEFAGSFYEILGVSSGASRSEIRSAYKSLVTKWHPDVNEFSDGSIFTKIQRAYEVLSNSEKRKFYDFYEEKFEAMEKYFNDIIKPNSIEELYSFSSGINILYEENFKDSISLPKVQWIVHCYNPRCAPCREKVSLVKSLARLAKNLNLKTEIKIGVINCMASRFLCSNLQLQYMGQFVLFEPDQKNIDDWDYEHYNGPMQASNIIDAALKIDKSKFHQISSTDHFRKIWNSQITPTLPNILDVERVGIVQFFSPNCFHCRTLRKELKQISRGLPNFLSVAYIDCSKDVCSVPYFPYLKLLISRRAQVKIEEYEIDFTGDQHSGTLSVSIIGLILEKLWLNVKRGDEREYNFEL